MDTLTFFDESILREHNDSLSFYGEKASELLSKSAVEFAKASKYHFELESIYSPAMNFNIVNEIADGVVSEIKSIL